MCRKDTLIGNRLPTKSSEFFNFFLKKDLTNKSSTGIKDLEYIESKMIPSLLIGYKKTNTKKTNQITYIDTVIMKL